MKSLRRKMPLRQPLRAATSPFVLRILRQAQDERNGEELKEADRWPAPPRPSRRTSRTAFSDLPPEPDDPLLGFAPYLHTAPRRNSITPDRQRAFIAALAATGIVTQAARSIGASLEALYRLRHQPGAASFSAAWELAIDRGIARLEDCALERAIHGVERVMMRRGEVVGRWVYYDTALLTFLLRQRRSARWNADGAQFAALRPGHPVYDRLRQEWYAEMQRNEPDIEDVRREVLARLAAISAHADRNLDQATESCEGQADAAA